MPSPDEIAALRARIARMDLQSAADMPAVPIGVEAIDAALPWGGLAAGALHEIFGGMPGDDAAAGFALLLLARFAHDGRLVLWCRNAAVSRRRGLPASSPYAPGLRGFGIDPGRMLLVQTRRDIDALWAVEETLKEAAFAAVLGELSEIGLTAGRRLQLAAEAHGVAALLLRPGHADAVPTAALTRWQVTARPSRDGCPAWRLDLVRCRGGRPGSWLILRDRECLVEC